MNKPLRVLMILHSQWRCDLGVARIQLELAEELRKLGHGVEKFSYEDAFPNPQSRFEELICNFSLKAKEFVKHNAYRFDIIDAHQAILPFNKQELGFRGLLVVRSAGLMPLYEQAHKLYKLGNRQYSIKTLLRKLISYPSLKRYRKDFSISLKEADLIILPNRDDFHYVSNVMRMGEKYVVIPFGLSDMRQKTLTQAIRPPLERLKNKEIVFIGYWSPRKGLRDWPDIIKRIRAKIPDVRFKFLGTGLKEEAILKDLLLPVNDGIKIVPHFNDEELPGLLAQATVGAFPSYIEGFGFAVLEKLACGLPVVSYDVPGVREMLRYFDRSMMVKPGDTTSFADNIINLLNLKEEGYFRLSRRCVEVSQKFRLSEIANQTLNAYSEFIKKKNIK